MVSFQTTFLELNQRKTTLESDSISKKRKWDHDPQAEDILPFRQWMNHKGVPSTATVTTTKYFSDIELHLETPLPSEWQRCLDIQSGEIHFYNTRTQKRTVRDPRDTSEEPTSPRDYHMSLDLELNLPCGSRNHNSSSKASQETKLALNNKYMSNSPPSPPTDLYKSLNNTIERNFFDDSKENVVNNSKEDGEAEMVAAACMRCHMLVMLQKSSPTCPNCKFVHPPYHNPADLFKPTLSLSC
ncbi:hypothetical protein KSS87_010099 [Heliosperma pusillum]|nr:hypothetical protein KSS87_010099 [Heliosperma pusillum]